MTRSAGVIGDAVGHIDADRLQVGLVRGVVGLVAAQIEGEAR